MSFRRHAVGFALVCALVALPAWGQPAGSMPRAATWDAVVDLSGPWRYHGGDDPAFASPDLDDSAWPTLALPEARGISSGRPTDPVLWLRRTVEVPAGTAPFPVGLSLGASSGPYEVFVQGKRVAVAGRIEPFVHPPLLPHFFAVDPPSTAGRLVIALRYRQIEALDSLRGRTFARFFDGPYLVGPVSATRLVHGHAESAILQRSTVFSGVNAVAFSLVAAVFFYLYRLRPSLKNHLWFAALLALLALHQALNLPKFSSAIAWLSLSATVRLTLAVVCASVIVGIELFCPLLLLRPPGRLARAYQALVGVVGLLVPLSMVWTARFYTLGYPLVLLQALPLPLVLALAARGTWRGQQDASILLAGALCFVGPMALSSYLMNFRPDLYVRLPMSPAMPGILLIVVAMVLVLARQFVRDLERGEREVRSLNIDLEAHIDQLERQKRSLDDLNTELRHQIALRSRQLSEALARIGAVPERDASLAAGDRIEARYQVLRPLGEGGMGAVYEVERLRDGARFALKILRGARKGEQLSRFAREAQVAAQVDHPNVVAVRDVDVAASGALFVVMDLVPGHSLEELRDRFGDQAWALPLLRQVAAGLAALHAAGVVHRDVKPANVLVDDRGQARIADFGISALSDEPAPGPPLAADARAVPVASGPLAALAPTVAAAPDAALAATAAAPIAAPAAALAPTVAAGAAAFADTAAALSPALASTVAAQPAIAPAAPAAPPLDGGSNAAPERLTRAGVWMGTPAYMAPELARGATEASAASDVWAFGVMACEVLAGRAPFDAPPLFGLMAGIPAPAPRILLPAGPLADLVARCLEVDRARRPTAAAIGAALASLGPVHSTAAATVGG